MFQLSITILFSSEMLENLLEFLLAGLILLFDIRGLISVLSCFFCLCTHLKDNKSCLIFRQKPDDEDDEERLECLSKDVEKRKFQLNEIEDDLPRESGLYLKIILGTVNVNILDKAAR